MLTLVIRTDKPEAEIYLYENGTKIAEHKWEAHRELSNTLHRKITDALSEIGKSREDLRRVVIYEGPGSFTGLRIGFSVANAIGYALEIPVITTGGKEWIKEGLEDSSKSFKPLAPKYGKDPHITKPRK